MQCEVHIVKCECKKKENNCVDKSTKAGRCVFSFVTGQISLLERERDSEPSGALPNQCDDGSASAAGDDDDEGEEEEEDKR